MTTDDDPISAASAGLRALGVAPQRRVETLGLLSALMDLADAQGEVILDDELMRTEERLGIDACLEGYEWLERLGVIRRTWSGWVIDHFDAHHGPEGLNEAAMAVLQKHMTTRDDAPVLAMVPNPAAPSEDAPPLITLQPWRRRATVLAASVAAGVAVLAGAVQLVPQAAVTARNASNDKSPSTVSVRSLGTTGASVATTAGSVTGTAAPTTAGSGTPAGAVVTTSTSTTVLPNLPCVSDVLNQLGHKSGLLRTPTSQTQQPGALPCP